MLLIVLGPADRETIGGDAEQRTADRKNDDEEIEGQSLPGGPAQPFAPASASSTSVAWVTPVAPRDAYGIVFRK